jgi:uncharacterized protein (DUF433 family)/DNA-binding transcriptional MerR regulator
MADGSANVPESLVGIGIYTPAEAMALTGVPSRTIRRWLAGYRVRGQAYGPLWTPQIDIGDEHIYLGFRDLTEVRVVHAFLQAGLSHAKIRRAIEIAEREFGLRRPLSTTRFRTDGKRGFLLLSAERPPAEGDEKVVDLFKSQYAIERAVEPSFRGLEFDEHGEPRVWRIAPGVLLDPTRAFGQPVEDETFVPTRVLRDAVAAEGSVQAAAAAYRVSPASVQRALAFEDAQRLPRAA